jgi:hypothetical protein
VAVVVELVPVVVALVGVAWVVVVGALVAASRVVVEVAFATSVPVVVAWVVVVTAVVAEAMVENIRCYSVASEAGLVEGLVTVEQRMAQLGVDSAAVVHTPVVAWAVGVEVVVVWLQQAARSTTSPTNQGHRSWLVVVLVVLA